MKLQRHRTAAEGEGACPSACVALCNDCSGRSQAADTGQQNTHQENQANAPSRNVGDAGARELSHRQLVGRQRAGPTAASRGVVTPLLLFPFAANQGCIPAQEVYTEAPCRPAGQLKGTLPKVPLGATARSRAELGLAPGVDRGCVQARSSSAFLPRRSEPTAARGLTGPRQALSTSDAAKWRATVTAIARERDRGRNWQRRVRLLPAL